jgi:hypothetical protein
MAAVLGLVGAAAVAFAAPAPAPRPPRAELEGLQASVEAAVTRVSRPAGPVFGRPSRAYHLKGYGAFVVLAPRALPRVHRHTVDGPEARAYTDALRRLERLRAARPHRDPQALQEEAEAFRREVERAMEKAERDVLIRLRVENDGRPVVLFMPPGVPEVPEMPEMPEMPEVPDPPDAPIPAVIPQPAVPAVPALIPRPATPAVPAVPAMPPGWSFWFGDVEGDDAPPDRVLADVRGAIVAGLGGYRGSLALLGPDEFVVVAVDFVPRIADRAGSRTVVARARKRDLAEHRAGRLSAAALQTRVEFDEY